MRLFSDETIAMNLIVENSKPTIQNPNPLCWRIKQVVENSKLAVLTSYRSYFLE